MESQPQNAEFRNNPENLHPCRGHIFSLSLQLLILLVYAAVMAVLPRCTDSTEPLLQSGKSGTIRESHQASGVHKAHYV